MSEPLRVSRRVFIAFSGAAAAGGLTLALAPSRANASEAATFQQPFLRIGADGLVTVFAKHLDMGQGIWTGLTSIVAEELDADWSQMRVDGAPVDKALYKNLIFGIQTTGGSTSTANSWLQLRRAGATARAMLVQAAASKWRVPAEELQVSRGIVSHHDKRRAGFGELAAAAAALPVPTEPPLKPASAFALLGHALPRLDAAAKSHGVPMYAIDIERPGMRVALLQRPPRFGAVLASVDDRAAREVPGVVDVVQVPGGVAVIAEHTWAAIEGRRALQVTWQEDRAEKRSSAELAAEFKRLATAGDAVVCATRGDAAGAMSRAVSVVEAEFEMPYLAHAPMEPLCAVGEWLDGRCEVWAGIQNQTADQAALARILELPLERVTLHTLYAGGSFGRRATFSSDWISEFAQVLKATRGAYPVKLMWTREDDIRGGFYRPLNLHRLRAGVAADGSLLAVEHMIVAQSFLFGAPKPGVAQRPDPTVFEGHFASRYDVADASLRWVNAEVGVPVQMYRALSHNHTSFAKEVFIDELARRAGRDPLAYRLAHLSAHPRQAAVLRLAAEKAGWSTPWAEGVALGLAVQEANNGTFVAQVAQVRLEGGAVQVERVVCAIDCGIVLNPDIVRSQVEGGIAFGLGGALHGRITLDEGRVVQSNFNDFAQLRLTEMPRAIEVHFIEGGSSPTGVGEPGSVLIGAAVANAVARLTGRPVRSLPLLESGALTTR